MNSTIIQAEIDEANARLVLAQKQYALVQAQVAAQLVSLQAALAKALAAEA